MYIDAEKLMIGDYIRTKHGNIAIVDIVWKDAIFTKEGEFEGEEFAEDEFEPIPLTPEILEKNGFTYYESDGSFVLPTTMSYGNWDVDVVLFNVTHEYRNNQLHIATPDDSIILLHLMECNHVHELQHALRLCGIDKEIKL